MQKYKCISKVKPIAKYYMMGEKQQYGIISHLLIAGIVSRLYWQSLKIMQKQELLYKM